MSTPRATVEMITTLGALEPGEFTRSEIDMMIPTAHSLIEFQMKPDWQIHYKPDELDNVENILKEAECYLALGRLFSIKAEKQLAEDDEDSFVVGSVSISPGGAQQRIFNKDYQFLADKFEMKAQSLINLVIPNHTRLLFKITNKKGRNYPWQ